MGAASQDALFFSAEARKSLAILAAGGEVHWEATMRKFVASLLKALMFSYVLFLLFINFVTLLFFILMSGEWSLPWAGFVYGSVVAFFVSLLITASAAVIFSFSRWRGLSVWSALILLLPAVSYWWIECGHAGTDIDTFRAFGWNVPPALLFAACVTADWLLRRSSNRQPEMSDGAS